MARTMKSCPAPAAAAPVSAAGAHPGQTAAVQAPPPLPAAPPQPAANDHLAALRARLCAPNAEGTLALSAAVQSRLLRCILQLYDINNAASPEASAYGSRRLKDLCDNESSSLLRCLLCNSLSLLSPRDANNAFGGQATGSFSVVHESRPLKIQKVGERASSYCDDPAFQAMEAIRDAFAEAHSRGAEGVPLQRLLDEALCVLEDDNKETLVALQGLALALADRLQQCDGSDCCPEQLFCLLRKQCAQLCPDAPDRVVAAVCCSLCLPDPQEQLPLLCAAISGNGICALCVESIRVCVEGLPETEVCRNADGQWQVSVDQAQEECYFDIVAGAVQALLTLQRKEATTLLVCSPWQLSFAVERLQGAFPSFEAGERGDGFDVVRLLPAEIARRRWLSKEVLGYCRMQMLGEEPLYSADGFMEEPVLRLAPRHTPTSANGADLVLDAVCGTETALRNYVLRATAASMPEFVVVLIPHVHHRLQHAGHAICSMDSGFPLDVDGALLVPSSRLLGDRLDNFRWPNVGLAECGCAAWVLNALYSHAKWVRDNTTDAVRALISARHPDTEGRSAFETGLHYCLGGCGEQINSTRQLCGEFGCCEESEVSCLLNGSGCGAPRRMTQDAAKTALLGHAALASMRLDVSGSLFEAAVKWHLKAQPGETAAERLERTAYLRGVLIALLGCLDAACCARLGRAPHSALDTMRDAVGSMAAVAGA